MDTLPSFGVPYLQWCIIRTSTNYFTYKSNNMKISQLVQDRASLGNFLRNAQREVRA